MFKFFTLNDIVAVKQHKTHYESLCDWVFYELLVGRRVNPSPYPREGTRLGDSPQRGQRLFLTDEALIHMMRLYRSPSAISSAPCICCPRWRTPLVTLCVYMWVCNIWDDLYTMVKFKYKLNNFVWYVIKKLDGQWVWFVAHQHKSAVLNT